MLRSTPRLCLVSTLLCFTSSLEAVPFSQDSLHSGFIALLWAAHSSAFYSSILFYTTGICTQTCWELLYISRVSGVLSRILRQFSIARCIIILEILEWSGKIWFVAWIRVCLQVLESFLRRVGRVQWDGLWLFGILMLWSFGFGWFHAPLLLLLVFCEIVDRGFHGCEEFILSCSLPSQNHFPFRSQL